MVIEMSTRPNPIPAFYWWLGSACLVGLIVTGDLLAEAEITLRWAHYQYEIHEETAMGISCLIWVPIFFLLVAVKVLSKSGYRSKTTR